MKQLILTVKNPMCLQLEVKDFLDVCNHSPQWIGEANNWEIKSFCFHTDEKNRQSVTALLENKTWNEPQATALTVREIFERVNTHLNKTLFVGFRTGCGKTELRSFKGYHKIYNGDFVLVDYEGESHQTVRECFEGLGLLPSFEDCTASDPVKEYYNQRSKESLEENLELLTDVQALVGWPHGETLKSHPITEVVVGEDSVALIYNQDVIAG